MAISHDHWFLYRIATHILACEGDSKWTFFDGNYQEYEADKRKRLGEEGAKPKRIAGSYTIIRVHLPYCQMKGRTNESSCFSLKRSRYAKGSSSLAARFREGAPTGRANRHDVRCAQTRHPHCRDWQAEIAREGAIVIAPPDTNKISVNRAMCPMLNSPLTTHRDAANER